MRQNHIWLFFLLILYRFLIGLAGLYFVGNHFGFHLFKSILDDNLAAKISSANEIYLRKTFPIRR